jgi:hypothetical protein
LPIRWVPLALITFYTSNQTWSTWGLLRLFLAARFRPWGAWCFENWWGLQSTTPLMRLSGRGYWHQRLEGKHVCLCPMTHSCLIIHFTSTVKLQRDGSQMTTNSIFYLPFAAP